MRSKDVQAAKTLGETGGLGTVATRADIIEKLFHTFLMEKRGSDILLTSKAKTASGTGAGRLEKAGTDCRLGDAAFQDRPGKN